MRSRRVENALIVSHEGEIRQQIHQILERSSLAVHTTACASVEDGLQALKQPRATYQAVFISQTTEPRELAEFIEAAKKLPSSCDAAIIVLMKSAEMAHSSISDSMIIGAHGFLCEPFTVSAAEEVLNLSRKVRLQHSKVRLRAATGLLLHGISQEGKSPEEPRGSGNLWQDVQESCKRYREITGESVTTAVVSALHRIAPSQRISTYNGVSTRVRHLFERKFRRGLNKTRDPKR